MVNKVFHEDTWDMLEVYMDDMIVKYDQEECHAQMDLEQALVMEELLWMKMARLNYHKDRDIKLFIFIYWTKSRELQT